MSLRRLKTFHMGKEGLTRKIHCKGAAYGGTYDLEMKHWADRSCVVCKGHLRVIVGGMYLEGPDVHVCTSRYHGYAHKSCHRQATKEARELNGEGRNRKTITPNVPEGEEFCPTPTKFFISSWGR